MSVAKLPRAGGPVRVDSAETLLPVTLPHEGGRGEQRRGNILLVVFFIFFRCYINRLKDVF